MKKTILFLASMLLIQFFAMGDQITLHGVLTKTEKGEKIFYKVKDGESKKNVALKFGKKDEAMQSKADGLVDKTVNVVAEGTNEEGKIKIKKVVSIEEASE
jgi:VCBS repeat-containing protein